MKRFMRSRTSGLLALTLLAGLACANFRKPKPTPPTSPVVKSGGVAPVHFATTTGTVTLVNKEHAFVVADFGAQRPPSLGTVLAVRRANETAGRVRLTEPVRGRFVTAERNYEMLLAIYQQVSEQRGTT